MTTPQDALLLSALELQLSAIGPPGARIGTVRQHVASAVPAEWLGPAREAFAVAVQAVGLAVDAADDAASNAIALTSAAVREVAARA